jgi:hypothetical protein
MWHSVIGGPERRCERHPGALIAEELRPMNIVDPATQLHPTWCDRKACTAYDPDPAAEGCHRSAPVVVATDDPSVGVFVFRTADPDGGHELIEMARIDLDDEVPWHLAAAVLGGEISVPRSSAEALIVDGGCRCG